MMILWETHQMSDTVAPLPCDTDRQSGAVVIRRQNVYLETGTGVMV